jgi:hypothetical protein
MRLGYLVRALNELASLTCTIRRYKGDKFKSDSAPTFAPKKERHKNPKYRRLREQPGADSIPEAEVETADVALMADDK